MNSGGPPSGSGTFGGLATIASGGPRPVIPLSGSILNFELGTLSDLICVSGGTLTGPSGTGGTTLNLSDSGGFAAGSYALFSFAGTSTSGFDLADFTFGTTICGFDYGLAFNGSTLELTSSVSAVPEPSTYAAICGVAALALAALRRRRSVIES